jgi:hypothetical protein
MLLMARRIIEEEKACCKTIGLIFEDVNCVVDLLDEVICGEISISIFTRFEDDPGLTGSL